ncbi:MAG: septum site-determining protein MinD [Candidatus Dadabacteria bacterium]|nr:MAG: septum site-determining protein MinD [Candidatus Dadabacteria bacterium]
MALGKNGASAGKKNSAASKGECQVIVVTSGKGGVGKTTTVASVGAALAMRGKRVLVVDADIGLRNLDVILGLENRVVFHIVDVAKGVCKPHQALVRSKKSSNLFLLPASQTDEKDVISEEEVRRIMGQYQREFDFILVDSPAGIEQGFKNAVAGAKSALIVTTPEIPAIRDADRVIGLLSAEGIESRLVVNRVDFQMVRRGDMLSIEDVEEILGIPLIGVVERDEGVIVAANCGEPVVYNNKTRAGEAFYRIAARLCGEQLPFLYEENSSWLKRLSRRLGMY